MKKIVFSTLSLALTCAISTSSFGVQAGAPAAATATQTTEAKQQPDSDKKIRFTFNKTDWDEVISWIADQAGFSLQPIADLPEGTFTLVDDSEYTVLEALDQINHALLIRPEPYTLIRNRDMLVLWKTRDANFPNDLIETVKVEDLDKRGKYETISCIFDVGELNAEDMYDELKPMIGDVHRNYFAVFPAANQLHIRETGGQLRDIRDLLKASQSRVAGQEISIKSYRLKHQDAETFMLLAGPLLGIAEGETSRPDEDLAISVDPFGDRMFVRGTAKMMMKFDEAAKLVDSPPEEIAGNVVLEQPYLKTYAVFTDPKLALNILDTMLEGLDVKMDQDETTGAISILGLKADHAKVAEYLKAISEVESDDFAIITLERRDPAEVIVILQSMFRQNSPEDSTEGPVLMAQSELYQILVRGTPQEVATVKRMVKELDDNANVVEMGPRTGRRIIDMSESEQEDILPMIEDLLYSNNRSNKLNIILPEDRKNIRSRIRNTTPANETPSLLDIPQSFNAPRATNPLNQKGSQLKRTLSESLFMFASASGINPVAVTGVLTPLQDEVGTSSEEGVARIPLSDDYKPAPKMDSVPGAPIEVRLTAYGIVLDSKDLDALDDLERAIYSRLGEESSVQLPQFFPLNHRQADEMLGFLETYYGLVEAGGGGGGGGMMAGMMNNMMGGGGDLLSGLLGGGTGMETGAALEGDVQFGVDMPFNMVYVRGATGNDLEEIAMLIDTLDRPDPPHNPELVGGFYTIDINFRDPTELKEIIESDLANILESSDPSKSGGAQNQEMAQMANMMKQLTGQGKRGSASADLEKDRAKGRLGVDPGTKKLLVTGPKSVYMEVLKRVELLDVPGAAPPIVEIMPDVGDLTAHASTLKAVFGDMVLLLDRETGEPVGDSTSRGSSSSSNSDAQKSSSNPQAAQADAMRKMIEAARAQQARGSSGRRTSSSRGGSSRGGSSRGGGSSRFGGR